MASLQSDNQSAVPGGPAEDEALLREARRLLPAVPQQDPRPGFAQRVAARAAEAQERSWLATLFAAPAFRWSMSGAAVAGALAVAVVTQVVARSPGPVVPAPAGEVIAQELPAGPELALAQRLDLYEDLSVVQEQEALEELDVVSVLHELQPEGKP
jgi:hypothetical protein